MINETRNELLLILELAKTTKEEERQFKLKWLLERFEADIKDQQKELNRKEQELKYNLELLDYVKKELKF